MIVENVPLMDALLIKPETYCDQRGFLLESYQSDRYCASGVSATFVQDNFCRSAKNVLRGLHFQMFPPLGKLVYVTCGEIFDVIVDMRKGSPSFAKWYGVFINDENHHQIYIPEGFAHGFCVMSDVADIQYKFSSNYNPSGEGGIAWNDPDVGIEWPIQEPIISERDATHPTLNSLPKDKLPFYTVKSVTEDSSKGEEI